MNKILKFALAGAAVFAVSGTANAGLLDFATYASGNEHAVINGNTETIGGYNIKFYAYDGNNDAFAYFDSSPVTAADTAGLGVCSILRGSQTNGNEYGGGENECNPSSDDNVTTGEKVELHFDFSVDISGLTFTNGGHDPVNGLNTLLINGVSMTFAQASAQTFSGQVITFEYGGTNANQFYVNGATADQAPAPAALGLFGLGLAGLGIAGRRRRS